MAPCGLRLVPSERVARFARLHEEGMVEYYHEFAVDLSPTPGTLRIGDTERDGTYQKRITLEVRNTGPDAQRKLKELTTGRWVAFYTDEHGRKKVSGSPLYPLELTAQPNGGTYTCTLTGRTPWMDLYVAEE